MNAIVKPGTGIIDSKQIALLDSSEARELIKEAHSVRRNLDHMYHILRGERLLSDKRWTALATMLQDVGSSASRNDIGRELGVLLAAFPTKENGLEMFAQLAANDIAEWEPTRLELASAFRTLRRTSRFRPSIAEMIEALEDAHDRYRHHAFTDLAPAIERAWQAHEAAMIARCQRLEQRRREEQAMAGEDQNDGCF